MHTLIKEYIDSQTIVVTYEAIWSLVLDYKIAYFEQILYHSFKWSSQQNPYLDVKDVGLFKLTKLTLFKYF